MYNNIVESEKILNELEMIFFGFFFLYLYVRKKFKVFFYMMLACFIYFIISYTVPNLTQGAMILILIGLFILVVVFSFNELNALDKAGKTVHEILQPDRIDWSVFFVFLVAWLLLKIFLF